MLMKPEKHILSKSTYIRGLQCKKSLYLYKNRNFLRDPLSAVQQAKFNRGTDIGELARQLFPGGINVSPKSPSQYPLSVERTSELIMDTGTSVIYEAAFQHDKVYVAMDILVRDGDGWVAYEVKSSLKISDVYMEDVALQYHVISSSGVKLNDIRILHLNPGYIRADELDIEMLFTEESMFDFAKGRRHFVEFTIPELIDTCNLSKSPPVEIGPHCLDPYPCEFRGHCWKGVQGNSIVKRDDDTLHLPSIMPSTIFLEIIAARPAVPLFPGNSPFHILPAGYSYCDTIGDHQGTHIMNPENYNPGVMIKEITNVIRVAAGIVVYDAEKFQNWLTQWSIDFPECAADFSLIRERFVGIKPLFASQSTNPLNHKDYELSAIAKALKIGSLNGLKVTEPALAGEICRQALEGGRQVKGFSLRDVEDYLGGTVNALIEICSQTSTDYSA